MKQFFTQMVLLNRGARSVTFQAHLGLTVGCAILFFLSILGQSGLAWLDEYVLGAVPDHELTVSLKKKDVAFFQVVEPGGKTALSSEDTGAMEALDGVLGVTPLYFGDQPSRAEIRFMGRLYETDLVVQGFDPQWIAEDVPLDLTAWEPGKTVPVVINTQLLMIFNNGYAKSQGLPQLSLQALMAPVWKLVYGKKNGPPVMINARIVGASPKVALGAAIPTAALEHLHQQLGVAQAPSTEAVLTLDINTDTDQMRRRIDELGYAVNEPHPLTGVFRRMKTFGGVGGVTLLLCLCVFAFSYLNQTLKMLFLVKKRDYAVCRAMGMSRARLRQLLFCEVFLLVAYDLVLGLAVGWLGAAALNKVYLHQQFLDMAGAPLQLLFPWSRAFLICVAALVSSMIFLAPRVLAASRQPVGEFLNQT